MGASEERSLKWQSRWPRKWCNRGFGRPFNGVIAGFENGVHAQIAILIGKMNEHDITPFSVKPNG
jgi:hypothetical protein